MRTHSRFKSLRIIKIAGYAIGSVLLPLGAGNKTSQLLKSEFCNLCQ